MMASAQARQQLPLRTPPSAWGTACPPLCAVRGAPDDVLLGPGPSLQILRRRFPALVRTLRGYYGPVRLLGGVRVGRAAVAFPHRPATSRQAPPRSPGSRAGSFLTCTGSPTAPGSSAASDSAAVDMAFPFCPQGRHPNLGISRLNRRPASASVNASPAMSPSPAHDSRSAWFATPSLWGSFIPNSPPVYPGAFGQSPITDFTSNTNGKVGDAYDFPGRWSTQDNLRGGTDASVDFYTTLDGVREGDESIALRSPAVNRGAPNPR